MPGEIAPGLDGTVTGRLEQARHRLLLRMPYLERNAPGRFKIILSLFRDHPVGIQPVGTAIKGPSRIEIPDLALQG